MKKRIIIFSVLSLLMIIVLLIPINVSYEGAPVEKIRLFHFLRFIIWSNPKILIYLLIIILCFSLIQSVISLYKKG